MPNYEARCLPIIYVRGYAMTAGEIDETTADPFCGFNLGSTVYRAAIDKEKGAKKFIFESPLVRLTSDFGYNDVYYRGLDIVDKGWAGKGQDPDSEEPGTRPSLPMKSIVIYRYYEQASELLGTGETPSMDDFARGLNTLIARVRELVCANPENGVTLDTFRCYLVAHSMGGLVCRAFLQNPALSEQWARDAVDKVFTYATPHNGIDVLGVNVPSWLTADDISNFSRDNMATYLKIGKDLYDPTKPVSQRGRVDWLPESAFKSRRFFCMVGTNRNDYEVAKGLSRTFVGAGSDGLVRIENASVWGVDAEGHFSAPCATAYAYRSHSGYFGIVNSEEAYQNLVRFLFGDLRVDIFADVTAVRLPKALVGRSVAALYQFGMKAMTQGKRWHLTRRVAEEDSVACRTHEELEPGKTPDRRRIYLSSVFLSQEAKDDPREPAFKYALNLRIGVPDYEVDTRFWPDSHYEGMALVNQTFIITVTPPKTSEQPWTATYRLSDWPDTRADGAFQAATDGDSIVLLAPFGDLTKQPGMTGQLRFVTSSWNDWFNVPAV